MARLRRSDLAAPGFRRRRRGRGFEYLDPAGRRIEDRATIERIRALVIPPAWSDVWICCDERGHIQAVGVDSAGRRQYRYHSVWRERADREKFDQMLEFARTLPRLRRVTRRHMRQRGPTRQRVLACAVRLLDRGFFRIGGEEYASEDGGYGLATLERRHVRVRDGTIVVFDYRAKGGVRRLHSIVDPEVSAVIADLKRRRASPDTELLAHRNGRWVDVRAADINDYVREASGGDFTSKHFRTWHGTVLAAVALAVSHPAARSKTARTRAMSRAVREVAHYLGNTPAVARSSYIDPRVFDRFQAGETIAGSLEALGAESDDIETPLTHGEIERAVVELLEG